MHHGRPSVACRAPTHSIVSNMARYGQPHHESRLSPPSWIMETLPLESAPSTRLRIRRRTGVIIRHHASTFNHPPPSTPFHLDLPFVVVGNGGTTPNGSNGNGNNSTVPGNRNGTITTPKKGATATVVFGSRNGTTTRSRTAKFPWLVGMCLKAGWHMWK